MDYLDYSHGHSFVHPPTNGSSNNNNNHHHPAENDSSTPRTHQYPPSSPSALQEPSKVGFYPPTGPPNNPPGCDIKPRLTKDQHDRLEEHYQTQAKPNTNTKRAFAQALNVSLDKVNNWFQNRRARAKQEAKKQASVDAAAATFFASGPPQEPGLAADSDSASSSFTPPDYLATAQTWPSDDDFAATLDALSAAPSHGMAHTGSLPMHPSMNGVDYRNRPALLQNLQPPPQWPPMMFDGSADDFNRRTLTQEQFDAFARNGGMTNGAGAFEDFETGFSGDQDILSQVFPEANMTYKHHDSAIFPYAMGAPMSSYDSTVPSNLSEQSLPIFPTSTQMQNHATASAPSSDYADSRQSSLSFGGEESQILAQTSMVPLQSVTSTSQWQPGQSVPVDINDLNEQFRQVAQAAQARPPIQHAPSFDGTGSWSAEDAAMRRGSQTTLLAQSLSSVGLHTPQPAQPATFKSPAPPSNIAARRQRTRPAPLGLAALRSQSYSDGLGPNSAGPTLQQSNPNGAAPGLRRIRSSNVVNGLNGVAPGRVMKSIPGSAQRSPLHFTFADSIHSPKFARHFSASQESATPPMTLSPHADGIMEQNGQFPFWSAAGSTDYQDPDVNAGLTFQPFAVGVGPKDFAGSSPPHTPRYRQQSLAHALGANAVIPENTPPQSAPASQQSFPSNIFAAPPPSSQSNQDRASHGSLAAPNIKPPQPQQQYMNVIVPDPQPQPTNVVFAPHQQFTAQVSGPPLATPIQFANGVPVVTAEGNIQMSFPPASMQFAAHQFPQQHANAGSGSSSEPNATAAMTGVVSQPQTYQFVTKGNGPGTNKTPSLEASCSQLQFPQKPSLQQPAELTVHEYTPPADLKRSASPRKPSLATAGAANSADMALGPKNYTFANHTSEHFEGNGKGKKQSGGLTSGTSGADGSSVSPKTGNFDA